MSTSTELADLPEINPFDPDFQADPVTALARVRSMSPIARTPFGIMFLRYEDVQQLLRDPRFHQGSLKLLEFQGLTDGPFYERVRRVILNLEGEEHHRLRRLVAPAFKPSSADALRPFMRTILDELVDALIGGSRAADGSCDAVAAICEPYPIPVICELVGAPRDDWEFFSRVATSILKQFNLNLSEDLPEIVGAIEEMDAYAHALIEARRRAPGNDFLSALIAVEEAGDRLSRDELTMMLTALLVAGTDTTRNQLGRALELLCRHPDQWDLLGERPELAPGAVEECMRLTPAITNTGRVAVEDVDWDGVRIPAGTMVSPGLFAANMDPSVWDEPERFDITRQPGPGVHQLTFGGGIHYCLGAQLARAELQEALVVLPARLPRLRVAGSIEWRSPVGIYGPSKLPVAWG